MSKYHNRKTEVDGILFDSAKEARRYLELRLLERAGKISGLKLQPEYELQPSFTYGGRKYRKICYKADFSYFDNELNKVIVEDVKGVETPVFKLKRKMLLYVHGIEIKLI